jgi:hypothetical protein
MATFEGNARANRLASAASRDDMGGKSGNVRFVFDSGEGDDPIAGVVAGGTEDRLDLSDAAFDFVTFSDVHACAGNTSAGVLIDLGAGQSVALQGVTEAQLNAVGIIL